MKPPSAQLKRDMPRCRPPRNAAARVAAGPLPEGSGPYWTEIDHATAAKAAPRATSPAGKGRDDDDD